MNSLKLSLLAILNELATLVVLSVLFRQHCYKF